MTNRLDSPDDFDVLKPADAAKALGVSERTLRRMGLPKVRRGAGTHNTGYLRRTIRLAQMRPKAVA